MRNEDWRRVEELFHGTLPLVGEERDAYLSRECSGDEPLRREVESLVRAFEEERSFIEEPALSLGMRVLSGGQAGSLVGRSVGHYRIIRVLGQGGMGEVYLAEDEVLERPVALKFIAGTLIGDEWAREQLLKEARAVARLESPNICAVYGVEQVDGHHFIVMQYIEGETLASHLRRGALGVERALGWARQLVGGLSAAHACSIIHRDVKPQNIMVTADDHIKVLDFGLAKLTRQMLEGEGGRDAPGQNTQAGLVAGTIAYMSPEQARGEVLDGRSDIFSFGVVLCEMLGCGNPFLRETEEETIAVIKSAEGPELKVPAGGLPAGLERVILKCLAKERALRYATADQLLRDLNELRNSAAERTSAKRGRFRLGHYAAAAAVFVLLLLAGAGLLYEKLSRTHTLAVLPIVNRSQEPGVDYLSEGLTRNLSDKFSYLPRLRIRLPSVKPDRQQGGAPLEVGRELRADAVLLGELLKQGESLLLHLRLLDTSDGSQTWEQTFDLGGDDLFAIQDEITKEVAGELGLWLVGGERQFLYKRQTDSREALNLYMRGRHLWSLKRNRQNIREAINLFERAIELDPSFAKAYAGLADSYALTNVLYGVAPIREAMDKARWAARKAIELDDSLAEAHTSVGLVSLRYEWDWQESEREFKRAIELNPEYAPARFWYSNLLAARGRFDESIKQGELAKSYDPYSRLADMNYGRALYYQRRYDAAAAHFATLLEQNPDYPQFLHVMGFVLVQQGRFDEAIAALEKLHAKDPLHAAAALGYAYGKAGRGDDARRVLRELDELSKTEAVPPQEKALVYLGLGDRDMAFAQLEACYEARVTGLIYLTTDPIYDDLRTDPRFAELAGRLNLPT